MAHKATIKSGGFFSPFTRIFGKFSIAKGGDIALVTKPDSAPRPPVSHVTSWIPFGTSPRSSLHSSHPSMGHPPPPGQLTGGGPGGGESASNNGHVVHQSLTPPPSHQHLHQNIGERTPSLTYYMLTSSSGWKIFLFSLS